MKRQIQATSRGLIISQRPEASSSSRRQLLSRANQRLRRQPSTGKLSIQTSTPRVPPGFLLYLVLPLPLNTSDQRISSSSLLSTTHYYLPRRRPTTPALDVICVKLLERRERNISQLLRLSPQVQIYNYELASV